MHTSCFESLMLVCFGASWPFSIAKTLRTRCVRGKSAIFLALIVVGYASGIVAKFLNADPQTGRVQPVVWLYGLNLAMVAFDLCLYGCFRNNRESRAGV